MIGLSRLSNNGNCPRTLVLVFDKEKQTILDILQQNEGLSMFKEELSFFIENQDSLVKQYPGQVLVIKGKEIIGVYKNALDAYLESQKKHKLGTFMIQPCEAGTNAYTVSISSSEIVLV